MIEEVSELAVSNGSACSSSVFQPSHVLVAMGLCDEDALSSIRFSLGKYNTIHDVEFVLGLIKSRLN